MPVGKHGSDYERMPRDLYETPAWVTDALVPHLMAPDQLSVWEPAAGSGKMADALLAHGYDVYQSDIELLHNLSATGKRGLQASCDFLKRTSLPVIDNRTPAIITNPPYKRGVVDKFVRHALKLTQPYDGMVAMLLKVDFDCGSTRADIFENHPAYLGKVVLTRRIVWFDSGNKNGPKENHAWFIWDWRRIRTQAESVPLPTIRYAAGPARVRVRKQRILGKKAMTKLNEMARLSDQA